MLAAPAPAATLIADYKFQSNFNSSGGVAGPISPVGSASFATETVGCSQTKVMTFTKGSGVQLAKPTPGASPYSIVALFRLSDLSGYRRIFVPGGAGLTFNSDNGLYARDAKLAMYDNTLPSGNPVLSPTPLLEPNTYAEVALAVTDQKGTPIRTFFNGSPAVQEDTDTAAFVANSMRFFKDNDGANTGEDSAGAVSRIRIFDGVLTPGEVSSIFNSDPIAGGCNPAALAKAAVNGKVKVKKRGHRFLVLTGIDVSCPAGGSCSGSAKVIKGAKAGRATVSKVPKKLGKTKLSVGAGQTKAVKVKLTKKGSKALAAKGKLKATISVKLSAPGGTPAVASRVAKLKVP